MKHPYKLLIFDWDGTLMDSEAKIVNCMRAAAHGCGLPDPGRAAARNIIGLGLLEALRVLFPVASANDHVRLIDEYKKHFLQDATDMPLFQGVTEGLENLLENGYQLAVATGKARRGLERVLGETNTRHLFITTRCADEAFSKPHPKMLEDILEHTGFTRDEAIMIGDTTYDMEMAYNAGMARAAVTYGVHERERLLSHAPVGCFDCFNDLHAWLR